MIVRNSTSIDAALNRKLQKIRMLLLDVDGVLTDGSIYLGSDNSEYKKFNVQDGMGIMLIRSGGLKVGVITARKSEVVEIRARELQVDVLCQDVKNKLDVYLDILKTHDLSDEHVCFMGDDVQDCAVMNRAGLAIAVSNARDEIKKMADIVTANKGGDGAVREAIELILKSQNKWKKVIQKVCSVTV